MISLTVLNTPHVTAHTLYRVLIPGLPEAAITEVWAFIMFVQSYFHPFFNLVADRISNLKGHLKYPKCKVLDQPDVKDTLHKLHANYVLVPTDKAANNVIIVCKKYYIDALVKELGINDVNINNPTYIQIDDSFETIVKSRNQFITSVVTGNV